MHVYFLDNTNLLSEEHITMLTELLHFAAEKENIPAEAEVSINIVHDDEIQQLNRDYRGLDRPTDVLSFALEDNDDDVIEINDDSIPIVLGDIIVSIDKAKDQAVEYNHSFEREIGFLVIHGLLHLLGYDHMEEEEEKEMFQKQDEILGEFDLER